VSSSEQTPKTFDPVRFKEQERAGFNFVADRYESAMDAMRPAFDRIIELAELHDDQKLLDVACGPGVLSRLARQKLGANGSVLGVDIAEHALERARQGAAVAGLDNITFQVQDAENLSLPDGEFDRVVCSLGLMHFPTADAAMREFYRVLKSGGIFVGAVWSEAEHAPYINCAVQCITRNFPPPKVERPSMFRFGTPVALQTLAADAGFSTVNTEPVAIKITAPDAPTYWRQFLDVAGITAVSLAKQPPEVLEKLAHDVAHDLAPYRTADGYDLTSRVMLVKAVC
jgi:ubiquinone/menaquinone biosynthesis C-methylase UbiE